MEEAYKEVLTHYTIQNKSLPIDDNIVIGNCVYLLKIKLGTKVLYKIGKTNDIRKRVSNLTSNISSNYSLVSVSIDILDIKYCNNIDEAEELLLKEARQKITSKNKFFFNGHTECFDSKILVQIFHEFTRGL